MAKGQKRSSREAKKPKKPKAQAIAPGSLLGAMPGKPAAFVPIKKR
jgi:hypothetical protein